MTSPITEDIIKVMVQNIVQPLINPPPPSPVGNYDFQDDINYDFQDGVNYDFN